MAEEVSHGDTPTKRCTACGEVKPIECFYKRSGRKGSMSECKKCFGLRARGWQKENMGKVLASSAKWARSNIDRARENNRRWKKEHPDKVRAADRKRVKRNVESISNAYVAGCLGVCVSDLTPELIELKRQQIQVIRALKQLKEKANGK